MATWTMHLAIAKKLEDKLNIKNKNEFYFGNIVPDLERWVVDDLDTFVDYKDSHYTFSNIAGESHIVIDLDKFYKLNEEEIKNGNSLLIGYYCHLIVDYYLNDIITSTKVSVFDNENKFIGVKLNNGQVLKCNEMKRRTIKHREYDMFNKYLINNFEIQCPSLNDELIDSIKVLKNINLSKSDIEKIINKSKELTMLDTFKDIKYEYKMYNDEILLKYYNDAIEYVIKVFEKNI